MGIVMEFVSGNTKIRIRDDACNAPNQREQDAVIWERVCRNALYAIRRNPERYDAQMQRKGEEGDT